MKSVKRHWSLLITADQWTGFRKFLHHTILKCLGYIISKNEQGAIPVTSQLFAISSVHILPTRVLYEMISL